MRVNFAQRVVTILVLTLLAPTAEAQQGGKMWRIGYLSLAANVEPFKGQFAAFRDGLLTLGYVEGKNIVIEQRHAGGHLERLPELAAELVRLKIDILVAFGSASAARKVTSTIPIVFIVDPDPVGTGLVASLARPGGNVTGQSDAHADLVPKRLELLKEVVPSAARVAVLFSPASPLVSQLKTAQAAAAALGMTALPVEVKGPGPGDFDPGTIGKGHPEAILVIADPTIAAQRPRIVEFAVKHRLPTIGTGKDVEPGVGRPEAQGSGQAPRVPDPGWRRRPLGRVPGRAPSASALGHQHRSQVVRTGEPPMARRGHADRLSDRETREEWPSQARTHEQLDPGGTQGLGRLTPTPG